MSTPLHDAVKKNNKELVLQIIKKEGKKVVNVRDGYEQTPLHLACYQAYTDMVTLLISKGADVKAVDKNGWTPLHSASNSGEFGICKLLIEKGADVNAMTSTGTSPLHYLVKHTCDDPKLFRTVLEMMVQKGAHIDSQTNYGETPLHQACFRGRLDTIQFLIQNGADVNKAARSGESSLHFAARLGHRDVVRELLKAGADPNIAGSYGTCFDVAKMSNQLEILELMKTEAQVTAASPASKLKTSAAIGKSLQKKSSSKVTLKKNKKTKADTQSNAKEGLKYGVAFGIKRGRCDAPCKCTAYDPEDAERGGPCKSCGHFPVKHKNLGKVKSDSDSDEGSEATSDLVSTPPPSSELSTSASASPVSNSIQTTATTSTSVPPEPETNSKAAGVFANPSWTINGHALTFGDKLGVGTSAKVYKGTYVDKEVAIKVLKPVMDPKQMDNFKKELDIMSQLNSPDVVYFFGTCLEPKICIVMEYCSRGSLYHVLQAKNVNIDWSMVFKLAIGALRGINTLHTWKPQIVHRDLKSLNLLVDDAWNVKVCDFGLSRFTDAGNLSTLGKLRGTFAYCAPEVYFGERFSTKSDVYSIGVILWELVVKCITGEYERPYAEYKHLVFDFQIIIQTAKKGLRPSLPKGCPESFANLIKRCWDAEPENRPDCPEITAKLEEMKLEYEMNKEAWDSVRAVKVYTEEDMADEENNSSSILPGGGSHGNSSTSTARLNAGSGSTSTLSLSSSSSALDGSTTDTKSSQPSARDTPHNAAPNTTDKTDIASQPSTAPQQVDKDTKCSNSSSPTTTTVSEDSQISGRVGTNSQVETTTAKAENKKIKKLKKKKGSRRGSRVTDTTTEKKKSKKGSKVAKEGSKVGDPAKKEKKKKKKKKAVVEDA